MTAATPGTRPAATRRPGRASSPTACISSGSRRTASSARRCATARRPAPVDGSWPASPSPSPAAFARRSLDGDGCVRTCRVAHPRPGAWRHHAVTTYGDYREVGGFPFPMRIKQTQGGHPTLELTVARSAQRRRRPRGPDAVRTAPSA